VRELIRRDARCPGAQVDARIPHGRSLFFQQKTAQNCSPVWAASMRSRVPFLQLDRKSKPLVAAQSRWTAIAADSRLFRKRSFVLAVWGLELRVVVYRKRVHHPSPKNYQLDLFSPDDGYFEYSAVATNLTLTPQAVWSFAAGPLAPKEKTFAETQRASSPSIVVPTNSLWPPTSALAAALHPGP